MAAELAALAGSLKYQRKGYLSAQGTERKIDRLIDTCI